MLPATPEEVFDAYTDAEKQKIWFSILDEQPGIVEIEVDLRVGGKQTAVWGPDRDTLFRETQTFLEIDRPHRLVTESTGSSPDGMTMTTQHRDHVRAEGDGRRCMTVVQTGFPVPEIRDFFVARGVERRAGRIRRTWSGRHEPARRRARAVDRRRRGDRRGRRQSGGLRLGRAPAARSTFTAPTGPAHVDPVTRRRVHAPCRCTLGLAVAGSARPLVEGRVPPALVVAPVLELGSILVMTVPADLDPTSKMTLAACHVALVPVTVVAVLALRKRAARAVGSRADADRPTRVPSASRS